MTTQPRKILVTCALPYANGAIHLGHMLEHIQADIWVRFQRMRGNKFILFVQMMRMVHQLCLMPIN